MSEIVTFSEEHQAAILGYALKDRRTLEYLIDDLKITKDWLVSNSLKEIWPHVVGFVMTYQQPAATLEELRAYVAGTEGDDKYTQRFVDRISWCVKESNRFSWEVLQTKLTYWARDQIIKASCERVAQLHRDGKKDQAYHAYDSGALELAKISLATSESDQMVSSSKRIDNEKGKAKKRKGSYLKLGVKFLDDALGGIGRSDLFLIGGYTGSGKTEMVKNIAEYNALDGKRVGVFALEAEENEWENRIKFSYLARRFREDNRGSQIVRGHINYLDWFMRELPCLDQYEDDADLYIKEKLKNLKTYYRAANDFSTKTLEREVLRHHKEFDLLILDHIHYVDSEGESESNENQEMHKLLKTMRELVIGTGVPMVAVGHLRKKQGGSSGKIVPSIDDFHGSSNIGKIATAAILMSRARGYKALDDGATEDATLMRLGKFRREGTRVDYVGMTFFDRFTTSYIDGYGIGRLNMAETEWQALPSPVAAPHWAKHAKFWDFQETS